jgi:hypothetical protein
VILKILEKSGGFKIIVVSDIEFFDRDGAHWAKYQAGDGQWHELIVRHSAFVLNNDGKTIEKYCPYQTIRQTGTQK